ncbi:hypothetical protein ERX37_09055 [Macrococcus hajekii]|uniref:YbbR-like domain-containing protein n=1 Tax=Macrococcus hajekii TaxID=198482 RepID=A0A4R6BJD6_9STAP|nr:CdaR family protein [Macrococcus hajekii]TDM01631.1 hypothetical protein ERX37_09055 [Macrococcus hajekii]GGB01638.1 hypothetical protein GCM10007190_07140 [Macrococcus hajekii]
MLESKWGLRIISFVLALVLFLSVNDIFNVVSQEQLSQEDSVIIRDVPVETVYDKTNLYLSGAPQTVDVKIAGPQAIVKTAESMQDFNVKLDLSRDLVGDHKKKFKVEGLSDKLDYEVIPETANITLAEKVSVTNTVEAEVNPGRLATGYELIEKKVDPTQVTITGSSDEIAKVAYVKATLNDNTKLSESTTEEAEVGVFDNNLNKLDVTVKPAKVKVMMEVQPSFKFVKLVPVTTGTLPADLKLEGITLSVEEAKLQGKRSVLDGIGDIEIAINLDTITTDTTLDKQIPLPGDVSKVDPDKVTVKVDVSKK